jgi:hypothetical protein
MDPERTIGATYLVTDCRTFGSPGSVTIPAIEPTPNPATLRPCRLMHDCTRRLTLPIGAQNGPVVVSVT